MTSLRLLKIASGLRRDDGKQTKKPAMRFAGFVRCYRVTRAATADEEVAAARDNGTWGRQWGLAS